MAMMAMEKKIVIVVVNWNGYLDTIECLDSLQKLTYDSYQVLVVDNGSTDESVRMIESAYPSVGIVALSKNVGFAAGCNAGIRSALEAGADYIFLLNNDTVIADEKMLEEMVGFMERDRDIGMLSPVILYNKSHSIWFCGGELNRNTGLIDLWNLREKWSDPPDPTLRFCSFLAGCALLVRADVFNRIKGFHEQYFLTSEESELCIRIADLGYKLGVYEGNILYHKVSMSMGVGSPLQVYFLYRNKLLFVKRNAKRITLSDFITIIGYYLRGMVLNALKGKLSLSLAIIRGVRDFLLQRDGLGYYKGRL